MTKTVCTTIRLLVILAFVPACGDAPAGTAEAERRVTAATLTQVFAREGDHWQSPRLAADGAARVAAMLTSIEVDAPLPPLEARGATDAAASAWTPLWLLWREGPLAVLAADLDEPWPTIELRLPAAGAPLVRELVWSAVVAPPALAPGDDAALVRPAEHGLLDNLAAWGVQPRAVWGARPPRCASTDADKRMLTVHHTATSPGEAGDYAAKLRQIQAYHMDGQGWCDIGYHLLVTLDGALWEGRELLDLGAHVASANPRNVGLSFVGCFHPSTDCAGMEPAVPPEAMITAGGRLIGQLAHLHQFPVTDETVKGHRDFPAAATACPGDHLHARLPDLRAAALAALAEFDEPCPCDTSAACEPGCACDPRCKRKKDEGCRAVGSPVAGPLALALWAVRRRRRPTGGRSVVEPHARPG